MGLGGGGKSKQLSVIESKLALFHMATACMEVHKYVCARRNSRLISHSEIGFGHLLVEVLSVHAVDSLFSLTSTPKQSAGMPDFTSEQVSEELLCPLLAFQSQGSQSSNMSEHGVNF